MGSRVSQRQFNVRYYAAHRQEEIDRVLRRQHATIEWLRDLRRVPCADCGSRFAPYAMDFDHRDPKAKLFAIASGHALLKSRAILLNEVAKCDIVCANCHRSRTHRAFIDGSTRAPSFHALKLEGTAEQMRGRRKFRRLWTEQIAVLRDLRSAPCADCGDSFPWYVMEFDHRQPADKVRNLPLMAGRVTTARLMAEVEKCDIVCCNCHRVRTYRRRQGIRGSSSVAERLPSKQDIAGSSPVSRSDTVGSLCGSTTFLRSFHDVSHARC